MKSEAADEQLWRGKLDQKKKKKVIPQVFTVCKLSLIDLFMTCGNIFAIPLP